MSDSLKSRNALNEDMAASIGVKAYLFGYPLITSNLVSKVSTNTSMAMNNRAPKGQIFHAKSLPDASPRDVTPVAPNPDTLYMGGWFDLSRGPFVLSTPAMGKRYFMMALNDAWMNVFGEIGTRATGGEAQSFFITGPHHADAPPGGITPIRSPTNLVHIVGRIYCSGTATDVAAVHIHQDAITLTPCDDTGHARLYVEPGVDQYLDMKTSAPDKIRLMDAQGYFGCLASLMSDNPPIAADGPLLTEMEKIGIYPGRTFDLASQDPVVARGLKRSPAMAQDIIRQAVQTLGVVTNGWTSLPLLGRYGTDYQSRAATATITLGVRPEHEKFLHAAAMTTWPRDATYFITGTDIDGAPFDGRRRYRIHFPSGGLPPVYGHWSLSAFGADYFFVANERGRYALGADSPLYVNPDGSIDIHVQSRAPEGEAEANWLPVPSNGPFTLMIRLYGALESAPNVISGGWQPPPPLLEH